MRINVTGRLGAVPTAETLSLRKVSKIKVARACILLPWVTNFYQFLFCLLLTNFTFSISFQSTLYYHRNTMANMSHDNDGIAVTADGQSLLRSLDPICTDNTPR